MSPETRDPHMKEPSALEVVELQNGDRMTRAEFHRLYERLPEDFKAELIGGVVYVASPLKRKHATQHQALSTALFPLAAPFAPRSGRSLWSIGSAA